MEKQFAMMKENELLLWNAQLNEWILTLEKSSSVWDEQINKTVAMTKSLSYEMHQLSLQIMDGEPHIDDHHKHNSESKPLDEEAIIK